ncbi:hypothetical protein V8F20_009664 [Naviculisporaceae sp. PSN 640]
MVPSWSSLLLLARGFCCIAHSTLCLLGFLPSSRQILANIQIAKIVETELLAQSLSTSDQTLLNVRSISRQQFTIGSPRNSPSREADVQRLPSVWGSHDRVLHVDRRLLLS